MSDISQYLQDIMSAVYGEEVRGSIHDAIEIINDVSEVVLTTGTAVTSATSSSTGFFDDSLYLNTNTFELWKCVGTDSWASQGILKGDPGTPGTDGEDGNKWYRGTGVSGESVNPTVFVNSGVTLANPNDFYLNPNEGAIYHCETGGDPYTATWVYDFSMSGGGGGTSNYNDLTNKPTVNGTTLQGSLSLSDLGVPVSITDLNDVTLTSPTAGQILEIDSNGYVVNGDNVTEFARYGGSKTFSQLTASLLIAANVDKFFLCTDGGTISSADASNWVLPSGSVIPANSHIAVIEYSSGVYKFDDFGGFVDLTPLQTKTIPSMSVKTTTVNTVEQALTAVNDSLDEFLTTVAIVSGGTFQLTVDDTHGWGYKPWFALTSTTTNKNPTARLTSAAGVGTVTCVLTYSTDADDGTTVRMRRYK